MMSLIARALQIYLIAVTLCLINISTVIAATITVTSNADTSSATECILRDAITSINLAALQGGCTNTGPAFADSDRIEVALALPYTISLANGPLMVTQSMSILSGAAGIDGAETAIIRSAFDVLDRVFFVSGARITLSNFTISNGFAQDAGFPAGQALGGGIYATDGAELRLNNCIVRDNHADIGGGIGLDLSSSLTTSNTQISHNTAIAGAGVGAIDQSQVFLLARTIVEQNTANELGGGIGLRDASLLRIRGAVVTQNRAYANADEFMGGGLVVPPITEGGGVFASNSSRVLIDRGGEVTNNTAILGGGIRLNESELEAVDSVIADNVSEGIASVFFDTINLRQGFGGGIHVDAGGVNLQNSELRMNSASSGGGLFATAGSAFGVIQSTVAGNIAQNWGGGFYLTGDSNGGASNSTISGNTAGVNPAVGIFPAGGGVYMLDAGGVQLINATLAQNTAIGGTGGGVYMNDTNVLLWNSLLAGNNASFGSEFTDADGSLSSQSQGNLFGDASKTFDEAMEFPFFLLFPTAADVIMSTTVRGGASNPAARPLSEIISPLADNEGGTLTHVLPPNSPAVDAASRLLCASLDLHIDQRDKPRNDGRCDIGSVEIDNSACFVIKAINGNVINFCL